MVYSFQEGIPADYQQDFNPGIFYQKKHLYLQSPEGLYSFSMVDPIKKIIHGIIHFHLKDSLALSPLRSPYASYALSSEVSEKELEKFMVYTEAKLSEVGATRIIIKNPPEAYSIDHDRLLQQTLLKNNYIVQTEEISAIIPVTEASFESKLHRSEYKRLRKCRESGLVFRFVSLNQLPAIYNFLKTCRDEKGYNLSMTLEELVNVISVFPDHFFLTQVTLKEELVAANISIRVNEKVLYNFYHDHHRLYNLLSPVVFLNEGLYQFCQQQKLNLLDLGTSMKDGKINSSLLNFKLRLGAQPSRKLTFVKNIS
jgi:hypothetical protein